MISPKKQILGVVLVFILGVCGKLHFSSIGMWDHYVKGSLAKPSGLIFGEPRSIRSDEWLVHASWTLAQVNSVPPLAVENPSIGAESSVLIVGMPARHWSTIFRPTTWGYHLLSMEYAFSWQWMMVSVGLLGCLYLLFIRLTNGSAPLALAGALWVYYSSFMQWWFAGLSTLLLLFSGACVSFSYLWTARDHRRLLFAAIAFWYWAVSFALSLYPPFQIVLAFLGVALLPLLSSYKGETSPLSWQIRGTALAVSTILAGVVVLLFVRDNLDVFSVMTNTVYPGKRVALGGGYDLIRYFSGFFNSAFSEKVFPRIYGNVCEASGFVLTWPLAVIMALRVGGWREWSKFSLIFLYVLWVSNWIVFGVSESVATLSLWSFVPTPRAVLGLGLGSIFFAITAASRTAAVKVRSVEWIVLGAFCAALCVAVLGFDRIAQQSPSTASLWWAAAGVLALGAALFSRNRFAILTSVLIAVVIPNCRVNPLTSGLSAVTKAPFYKAVQEIDPERTALWAVFDTNVAPELAKTAGARVLNGVKYSPDMAVYKLLDPAGQHEAVYNRYANIVFIPGPEGSAPEFKLIQADGWHLVVDPCLPAFTELKVEYVAFYSRRANLNYSCLELVRQDPRFVIYKRKIS